MRTFLHKGWRVVGISRTSFDSTNSDYVHVRHDLLDGGMLFFRHLFMQHGVPDFFVNNAVEVGEGSFSSISEDDFRRVFGTNVMVPFQIMHLLINHYTAEGFLKNTLRNRSILNVSSVSACFSNVAKNDRYLSLYSASKAALSTLSFAASKEFITSGVRVNVIAPDSFTSSVLMQQKVLERCLRFALGRENGSVATVSFEHEPH